MENNNYIEHGNERIPTREEILDIIGRHAEKYTVGRELFDGKGLYLLEIKVEVKEAGETIEYQYIRKGEFPNKVASLGTTINVLYFDKDGIPCTSNTIAVYNNQTEEWEDIK